MSYKFHYSNMRRRRSGYSAAGSGFRKKEPMVLIPLLFILFLTMTFISPLLNNFFPTMLGRGAIKNISLPVDLDLSLLLSHSIPGMSLKADTKADTGLQGEENEIGNSTDRETPLQVIPKFLLNTELAGFGSEEVSGISVDPVHESFREKDPAEANIDSGETNDLSLVASPDKMSLEKTAYSTEGEDPIVLIYHTHTTESFLPLTGEAFSTNLKKTVVALGDYLTEILEKEYGIPVLHYCEVFDIPRRTAYEKARPSVKKVLDEHPGIEFVLDLHRDGVSRNITTASINGQETGRILFVLGSNHQEWNNNLRFALSLQEALEQISPGLSRGIRKQPFTYNQHLHNRSLIVEIGGHENSLEEVRRTIPYLAEALAVVIQ